MAEMSKAERKAALKAAKAAAKAEKKTAKIETKNVEEAKPAPQVDNTPKVEEVKVEEVKTAPTTKETKVTAQKDAPKSPDKPKKTEKIPTIIPEDANDGLKGQKKALDRAASLVGGATGIPMGSPSSSLDGKAMLSYVMWDKYGKNEELQKHYPELYTDLMKSIDVVTLLALVDVRQELLSRNEKGELNLVIDADQILPLQNMAGLLGIKLAPAKALPGKTDDKQLAIDFAKSEIPAELTPKTTEVKATVPELDPNKITNDEELKSALEYLISKDKNVADNIVNTVEWYRVFCGLKENDANKKLALDEKSVTDWINDIFKIIQPSYLMNGLGRAVYLYTSQTGSPCMAHAILHHHMSKLGWSEEQVAEALRALISENFRYKLKDDANLKPNEDKALKAITGILGEDYITKLFNDFNISTDGVADDKKAALEADRTAARMVLGSVKSNYFDKPKRKFTVDDLRLVVGQIINLYRDPADRLAEYCQDTIVAPKEEEYPKKAEEVKPEEKKK